MGLVAFVMVYYGAIYSFSFPGKTTEILEIPVVYIYIIIPISGLLMGVDLLHSMYRGAVRALAGQMPEESFLNVSINGNGGLMNLFWVLAGILGSILLSLPIAFALAAVAIIIILSQDMSL